MRAYHGPDEATIAGCGPAHGSGRVKWWGMGHPNSQVLVRVCTLVVGLSRGCRL